jgi:hypothetical protein
MADLQQELEKRQHTWDNFIRWSFWSAGIIAVILILMWVFLL